MIIRAAEMDDAEALAKVHVDSWRTTYRDIVPQAYLDSLCYEQRSARWRDILSRNAAQETNVVACVDGQVVGFYGTGPNRSSEVDCEGELYALYLIESQQGRGYGRKLFEHALAQLQHDGFTSVLVWVLKDNPACGFYEAMKAKPISEKFDRIGGKDLLEVAYEWRPPGRSKPL